jgi:2-hydroxychromene-2-carboxylate isomerase
VTNNTVDYYFTVTSPWSYLGHQKFVNMCKEHNWIISYKPVDFGPIFAQSGGLPLPQRSEQRRRYRLFELQRWRDFRGIKLNLRPKFFPTNPDLGNKLCIASEKLDLETGRLAQAVMQACWVEEKDIGNPETLVLIANEAGFDGPLLLEQATSETISEAATALTSEAMTKQIFGAPTYVINGEPFWGQDRLDFVVRALSRTIQPYKVEGPV